MSHPATPLPPSLSGPVRTANPPPIPLTLPDPLSSASAKLYAVLADHTPPTPNAGRDLAHWTSMVSRHFFPHAILRYTTAPGGAAGNRQFDLPCGFLPRYFWLHFALCNLVHLAFAPTSIPHEHHLPTGAIVVTVPSCSLFQQYASPNLVPNSSTHTPSFSDSNTTALVISQCALRVTLARDQSSGQWKVEFWDLVVKRFDEAIDRAALIHSLSMNNLSSSSSNTSLSSWTIPDPVANENGVHVRLMRALEIADVVNCMKDLILYSQVKQLGALQALHQISAVIDPHSRIRSPPVSLSQDYVVISPTNSLNKSQIPLPHHSSASLKTMDAVNVSTPTASASPIIPTITQPNESLAGQLTTMSMNMSISSAAVAPPTPDPSSSSPLKTDPLEIFTTITTADLQGQNGITDDGNTKDVEDEVNSTDSSNTSASLLLDAFLKSEPVSPNSDIDGGSPLSMLDGVDVSSPDGDITHTTFITSPLKRCASDLEENDVVDDTKTSDDAVDNGITNDDVISSITSDFISNEGGDGDRDRDRDRDKYESLPSPFKRPRTESPSLTID